MDRKVTYSASTATALQIAKRLVDQKVTNDLDVICSVVNVCKEDIVSYIKKPREYDNPG